MGLFRWVSWVITGKIVDYWDRGPNGAHLTTKREGNMPMKKVVPPVWDNTRCSDVMRQRVGVVAHLGNNLDGFELVSTSVTSDWGVKLVGVHPETLLILTPLTEKARTFSYWCKVDALVEKGIAFDVAKVAVKVKYGMEIPVINLAADLEPLLKQRPFGGDTLDDFEAWTGEDVIPLMYQGMGMGQIRAAIEIAECMVFSDKPLYWG